MAARSEQGAAQGVVARIDWARFLPLYQQAGRRAFLAELEREVPDAAPVIDGVREDPSWSSGSPTLRCSSARNFCRITCATR